MADPEKKAEDYEQVTLGLAGAQTIVLLDKDGTEIERREINPESYHLFVGKEIRVYRRLWREDLIELLLHRAAG